MRTHYTPAGVRIELDGVKLRGLRLSAGMTLAEVASAVGCSFASIGHYEREAMIPGAESIDGLRRVFGDALSDSGALVVIPWTKDEERYLNQRFADRMGDDDAE